MKLRAVAGKTNEAEKKAETWAEVVKQNSSIMVYGKKGFV